MTDLTEQWKKGELPEGHYYIKDGENLIAEYLDGYFYHNGEPMTSFSGGVDSVLEKVPSYEEYLALESDSLAKKEAEEIIAELENSIKDLKHRNENLRLALKTYELPEIQKILIDWRTGELDKKFNKLEKENTKLKEEVSRESYKVSEAYCLVEELKELLKECRRYIQPFIKDFTVTMPNEKIFLQELLIKINEVLK